MSETLLETKDVADRLCISVRRVRKLLATEQLSHVKIGRQFFVPEYALEDFLFEHMVHSKAGNTQNRTPKCR